MAKGKSQSADAPNVILPLASSYNERGVAGYTHTVTNSEDQRKINLTYEAVKNPMTGKGTLTLVKRPGVTVDVETYGSSSQVPYLISREQTQSASGTPWVFSTITSGQDVTVSTSGVTTTIYAAGAGTKYVPAYVDRTSISNVQNVVIQLRQLLAPQSAQKVYYSTSNTAAVWTEITDADFTGINLAHRGKMEHIDGYAFILGGDNRIWNSDSNSLANWTATSFLAKSVHQDFPVGLARIKNQLLAFGFETVEAFYNAGNTTGSPLGRIPQLSNRVGMINQISAGGGGTHYYATIGDRIYFVGSQSGAYSSSVGGAAAFSYDGSRYEKISTNYIDKILSEQRFAIFSVFQVFFQERTAIAFNLAHPSTATQRWLMFFPDWKEWFEWTSTKFSPVNCGEWFLGVANPDKVYRFGVSDVWQDDSTSYAHSIQFRLPSNGASRNFLNMYGLDADTDTTTNDQTVEISTDDTASWTTLGTLPLDQDRKVLFRGGSFRKAHIRIGATNARPFRAHNFLARIT